MWDLLLGGAEVGSAALVLDDGFLLLLQHLGQVLRALPEAAAQHSLRGHVSEVQVGFAAL